MKKISIISAFLLLLVSSSSFAGSGGGQITRVMVHSGDIAMLITETKVTYPDDDGCSTADGGKGWAISLKTETGRAMYSMALTAVAQRKNVGIRGTGACGAWGDREEPKYLYINN